MKNVFKVFTLVLLLCTFAGNGATTDLSQELETFIAIDNDVGMTVNVGIEISSIDFVNSNIVEELQIAPEVSNNLAVMLDFKNKRAYLLKT